MSFKISALVEQSDSFSFQYGEFELAGRYYKYKTRTPNYAKAALASLPEKLTEGTEEEKAANEKIRDGQAELLGWKWFTDTIIEWNAVDDNDQPVPISRETFDSLPMPFINAFQGFLDELINPKKEGTDSPTI